MEEDIINQQKDLTEMVHSRVDVYVERLGSDVVST